LIGIDLVFGWTALIGMALAARGGDAELIAGLPLVQDGP